MPASSHFIERKQTTGLTEVACEVPLIHFGRKRIGIPIDISEPDPKKKTYEGTRRFRRFAIPVAIGGDVYASHFNIREPTEYAVNSGVFYEFNLGQKMEPEDMGLPLTLVSRLSEDNLPFDSDSTVSSTSLVNKVKVNDTAEQQTLVVESFNYSIRDQAEIDQIETALGALNRGPEGRLAVCRMAKQKFLDVLRENRDIIDAIKATKIDVKAQLSPEVEKLDTELRDKLADLEVEELGATEEALNENEDRKQAKLEGATSREQIVEIGGAVERGLYGTGEQVQVPAVAVGKVNPRVNYVLGLTDRCAHSQPRQWLQSQPHGWCHHRAGRAAAGEVVDHEKRHTESCVDKEAGRFGDAKLGIDTKKTGTQGCLVVAEFLLQP
jgi:hypothetical protein